MACTWYSSALFRKSSYNEYYAAHTYYHYRVCTFMAKSSSFKNRVQKNAFGNEQMYVHKYRFKYDITGETTLEQCIIDIIAFVTDYPRDEARLLVRRRCQINIDDHFSMLDQLEKPKLVFWIGCLNITVNYDGRILVRKSRTQ